MLEGEEEKKEEEKDIYQKPRQVFFVFVENALIFHGVGGKKMKSLSIRRVEEVEGRAVDGVAQGGPYLGGETHLGRKQEKRGAYFSDRGRKKRRKKSIGKEQKGGG